MLGSTELTRACQDLSIEFARFKAQDLRVEVEDRSDQEQLMAVCRINEGHWYQAIAKPADYCVAEQGRVLKRLAKAAFVKALAEFCPEFRLPWGILTGIRPTKVIHRLFDAGMTLPEAANILQENYLIAPEKIRLGLEVAALQRRFLPSPQAARNLVSVYLGIPFCPSRCAYCSFPTALRPEHGLGRYLAVLGEEIKAVGADLAKRGIGVQAVYIGGGTPTVLDERELEGLLAACQENFLLAQTVEFTVEAGRPDTLNQAKLATMLRSGVNRLSINPQSMVQKTLDRVGRSHTAAQVVESFQLARELGFDNINMDLILGLPGESLADVRFSLARVAELEPDSITLHALAIKRVSQLHEQEFRLAGYREAAAMQETAEQAVRSLGMRPYYLYRQKQISGNLENIGYAKPGKESVYNIQIIEERQTIVALGAGAASKIVNPNDRSLTNVPNPKQPDVYYRRWEEKWQEKLRLFDSIRSGGN
ncbi:MAG TPA: coproporphyrinogen dehydrogenase HemZ [Desulfobacteria bacterium]|nr:coproporphyrinogen dehydrogenase HemZ [Desulfobacteria bacterium]